MDKIPQRSLHQHAMLAQLCSKRVWSALFCVVALGLVLYPFAAPSLFTQMGPLDIANLATIPLWLIALFGLAHAERFFIRRIWQVLIPVASLLFIAWVVQSMGAAQSAPSDDKPILPWLGQILIMIPALVGGFFYAYLPLSFWSDPGHQAKKKR